MDGVARPVRNLCFTQSYLAAVEAVSAETRLVADDFSAMQAPAVRIGHFAVMGVTRK